MPKIDRTGMTYGRLAVLSRAAGPTAHWLCACECGQKTVVRGNNLTRGRTKSCGCLSRETAARRRTCHGLSNTLIYGIYATARNRCENPNVESFAYYGARGIKFLYKDFEEFRADVGPRPPGMTLDRIRNDGNYEPGNCRWATRIEQNNNTRKNRHLSAFGQTMTVTQWARRFGINISTFREQIRRGLDGEAAICFGFPIDDSPDD